MFDFYKYIKPSWYYFLTPHCTGPKYFIGLNDLPEILRKFIKVDHTYTTRLAQENDISFQIFHKGFITKHVEAPGSPKKVYSLQDNYIFLRKYFKPFWSWFVLVKRIFSFNNPFSEIACFLKAVGIKRVQLYEDVFQHQEFDANFNDKKERVSVVIATLDRYKCLAKVLKSLELQSYKVSEVIVVDQSENFEYKFYKEFNLPLKIVNQKQKGQWTARNEAIKQSKFNLIAFCDDDVELESDWIENHVRALNYFSADISTGVFYFLRNGIPIERRNFKYAEQFSSNNSMVKRKVFQEIGLFDKHYDGLRWGDAEFGLRAYLAGFKSISNPRASCVDLKVDYGGLRAGGSWDAFKPANLLGIRPIPSVFYFYYTYFSNSHLIADLQVKLPLSYGPGNRESSYLEKFYSIIIFIFMIPFLAYSVAISWKIGKKMFRNGSKIDTLN